MKLKAYIDGGSRGNPGDAGIGVYFPGTVRIAEYLGAGTNNFAEYSALLTALRFAVFSRCEDLEVFADSELVVKQIKGEYQVRNEGIRLLYDSALRWITLIPRFSISHVRRENNKEADGLANLAMDTHRNSVKWEP
ncbi:MAG TPA: ribonuclease HI family protein [Terriglobia bacterium]|jgi:ribonuclease HI|nr:ribonuclease HI family protein [Terriglobia bacterium]